MISTCRFERPSIICICVYHSWRKSLTKARRFWIAPGTKVLWDIIKGVGFEGAQAHCEKGPMRCIFLVNNTPCHNGAFLQKISSFMKALSARKFNVTWQGSRIAYQRKFLKKTVNEGKFRFKYSVDMSIQNSICRIIRFLGNFIRFVFFILLQDSNILMVKVTKFKCKKSLCFLRKKNCKESTSLS